MPSQFEIDITAELAALSMVAMKALSGLAFLSGDKKAYLSRILEAGLRDLEKTTYWSIPENQRETFLENARARYTDLITGIRAE